MRKLALLALSIALLTLLGCGPGATPPPAVDAGPPAPTCDKPPCSPPACVIGAAQGQAGAPCAGADGKANDALCCACTCAQYVPLDKSSTTYVCASSCPGSP